MNNVLRIARKEFAGFFSSPVAFIFFGAFVAVTLFIFFWVETFFSRNIADVRPLFSWMPILLIFLTSAITMRLWAEERRAGTLELLLTSPVKPVVLVLGKFIACLGLVAMALALTLPLPITVAMLGPLDWGPVFGGYVATMFLAAAYIAIGLFVSARSDNQIVSLLVTVLLGSIFYLIGSNALTGLFGNQASELMKLLGSGSRFDSITRGVIDLRDLYYYVCLVGVFLSLNVHSLEKIRWAGNKSNAHHKRWSAVTLLLIANFVATNLWLAPIGTTRVDLTQGDIYSISKATRDYLKQLREPLLIRGYFSAQTHPLLAPLVPRLRDLIKEYQVAGKGKVRVEFIDPLEHQELEQEAGQKYGIRPVPFETTSKYQASVTNSYFDILIKYGDQFETLGFQDLIEVKAGGPGDIEVDLRNPEYDITRSIKKVLYSYQGSGNLFANITKPVVFRGYISPDEQLPEQLLELRKTLNEVLEQLKQNSKGKVTVEIVDPDAGNGEVAQAIQDEYGFQPMALSLFDSQRFWFHMTMDNGERIIQVPLPQETSKDELNRSIDAALKRFSSGFLKTVALSTPPFTPPMPQYGMPGSGKSFSWLRDKLGQEHKIVDTDLKNGVVPEEADLLLVVSPDKLDEKQLFAIDQFLMRGGTVILGTSTTDITLQGGLAATEHTSGLEQWLASHGLAVENELVLDQQNSPFPIPVKRQLGAFVVQETRMLDYPFFVDIREDGMDGDSGLTAGVNQISMNWAAPITVDMEKNKERRIIKLLHSSANSWTTTEREIQPDFQTYPQTGFGSGDNFASQVLAVVAEGRFESWFKGKTSPLMTNPEADKEEKPAADPGTPEGEKPAAEEDKPAPVITRVIEKSPESSRIIVFASNMFLTDTALQLASGAMRTRYDNPLQMVENCIDWSLEDRGLLNIRGRGHFARTLRPLDDNKRMFWEYLNYGLALVGLGLIWGVRAWQRRRAQVRYRNILNQGRA